MLGKIKKAFLDPRTLQSQELLTMDTTAETNTLQTKILHDTRAFSKYTCRVGGDVYSDVEFFTPFQEGGSTVFGTCFLPACATRGGEHIARLILSTPIHDPLSLQKRQSILRGMDPLLNDHLQRDFQQLTALEADVVWAFQEPEANLKDLYEMLLFRFTLFRPLNRFPMAITGYNMYRIFVSPLIGILSPVIYFIVPFLILSFKFKLRIPFTTYLKILWETLLSGNMFSAFVGGGGSGMQGISMVFSLVFYFQGLFNSVEISRTLSKITHHLVGKMNNVVTFLTIAHRINHALWTHEIPLVFMETGALQTTQSEDFYMNGMKTLTPTLFTNFGHQIHAYFSMNKDIVRSILTKVYTLDSLACFLHYKKQHRVAFADWMAKGNTRLDMRDVRHPCIPPERVVTNNLDAGKHNIILTGPNAGGKSTFVKSVLLCALFNQTMTISNASHVRATPFYDIHSQVHIPDSKGHQSLFEAEMYRCKEKLDLLAGSEGRPALFVMDEIFNSTNPVEGIAGAFAIAKKIAEHPQCLMIFTTHYSYLTKLHKTGRFINYRMNVVRTGNAITYPYKLERGVSRQYVALELLQKNGFDADIVTEALAVKERLTFGKGF